MGENEKERISENDGAVFELFLDLLPGGGEPLIQLGGVANGGTWQHDAHGLWLQQGAGLI